MTNTQFQNSFSFNLNADIVKSTGAAITKVDDLDYDNMFIEGIASDATPDVEGEVMSPENFDLSYLLGGAGKINSDHDKNLVIGQIVDAKIIKGNKLWIKGRLLSSSDLAKKIYKNAFEMQSDPASTIRASWSIEGKATERDPKNPNKVTKALITMVALTNTPINFKNTYAEIVKKSLNADSKIFENNLTDIQKSIMSNSNLDDNFKMELINLGISPENYIEKFISLADKNDNLTIKDFNRSLEIQKGMPEIDLNKCLIIGQRSGAKIEDLKSEVLTDEVKKAFICLNYLEKNENISDDVFNSLCEKMGVK